MFKNKVKGRVKKQRTWKQGLKWITNSIISIKMIQEKSLTVMMIKIKMKVLHKNYHSTIFYIDTTVLSYTQKCTHGWDLSKCVQYRLLRPGMFNQTEVIKIKTVNNNNYINNNYHDPKPSRIHIKGLKREKATLLLLGCSFVSSGRATSFGPFFIVLSRSCFVYRKTLKEKIYAFPFIFSSRAISVSD